MSNVPIRTEFKLWNLSIRTEDASLRQVCYIEGQEQTKTILCFYKQKVNKRQ